MIRRVLLESAPVALIGAAWIKLVVVSVTLNAFAYPEDRYVEIATLAALLVITSPLPFLRRRGRFMAAFIVDLVASVLILANLLHFRFFNEVLSLPDVDRAGQLPMALPAAVAALRAQDLLLGIDLVIAALCTPWYLRACHTRGPELSWRAAFCMSTAMLLAALGLSAPVLHAMYVDREELYGYTYSRQLVVSGIGLLPYHLHDAYIQLAYATRGRLTTSDADRARVDAYLRRFRDEEGAPTELTGIARGKNLIVVMAESLQAFPIGLEIDGQPVAPTLVRFASESIEFERFYDQTHMGTTADGEFTTMQALHPLTASAVATRYPMNQFRGLPDVLAQYGYKTISAVGEPGNEWNMFQMHPNLGFQESFFKSAFRFDFEFGLGIPDHVFLPQAAALLRTQPRPFMAYFITLSNHAPYQLPPELRALRVGALENTRLGGFLQGVHYFDGAIGAFLDELRASGLLDESVVVIYGDHHSFLDDAAALAQLLGIAEDDTRSMWKVEKQLPLYIRLPYGQAAGRKTGAAGHVDVAPTLLGFSAWEN